MKSVVLVDHSALDSAHLGIGNEPQTRRLRRKCLTIHRASACLGSLADFQNKNGVLEIKGHGFELAQNVETDETVRIHELEVPNKRALTKRTVAFS